jgi:hypothetical protein
VTPAFAKTWSIDAWDRMASLKRLERSVQEVTSVRWYVREGCVSVGGLRSPTTTETPCLSSSSVVARPMPEEPPCFLLVYGTQGQQDEGHLPVITATLPFSEAKSKSLTRISDIVDGVRTVCTEECKIWSGKQHRIYNRLEEREKVKSASVNMALAIFIIRRQH